MAADDDCLDKTELVTHKMRKLIMGEIVARNLINHLQGNTNMQNIHTVIVSSDLVVRKSSLKKMTKEAEI